MDLRQKNSSLHTKSSILRLFDADNIKTTLLTWLTFISVMVSFYSGLNSN
ncbi:MFS transporter [Kingella kingae]|nr:MFS transporter [Kingella kingae]MBD3613246.1 hypothetical protein [Kingella kingae]MBD3631604.1 hypothetical protein [Kingella kingae]MBD3658983.1 hypothetical protein [Kingella kingae]MDK4543852.1 MFS transporter [Kingella kingae]MDK4566021.1 MFS transporter [Kingella kingae]